MRTKRQRYVNLLLSDREKEKLEAYAAKLGYSMNELLRNYIRSLPEEG